MAEVSNKDHHNCLDFKHFYSFSNTLDTIIKLLCKVYICFFVLFLIRKSDLLFPTNYINCKLSTASKLVGMQIFE